MNNETLPVIERTADSVNLLITEKDQDGDFYIPIRMAAFTKLVSENAELKCKLEQAQTKSWDAEHENRQLKTKIDALEEMIKEWATK